MFWQAVYTACVGVGSPAGVLCIIARVVQAPFLCGVLQLLLLLLWSLLAFNILAKIYQVDKIGNGFFTTSSKSSSSKGWTTSLKVRISSPDDGRLLGAGRCSLLQLGDTASHTSLTLSCV